MEVVAAGIDKARKGGGVIGRKLDEAGAALSKTTAFKTLIAAQQWARQAVRLPASVLKDLTLDAINRLRQLPDDVLDQLSRLSAGLKRRALGCASPCRVDPAEVTAQVGRLTGRQAERIAVKESMAYWKVHETLTSFARHGQTFSSLARTLQNKVDELAKAGKSGLLRRVDDSVLRTPVDEFIRQNPRLSREWAALEARARTNPGLRREMRKFLEGSRGGGARNVGSRQPDIVEFFLDSGEIVVTDITLKVGDPVHSFKTLFYREALQEMVGPRGPRVFGLDIDPLPGPRVRAEVID